ncbi:MAG: ferritin family protein [Pseudomonadota bacterium]
MREIFNLAMRLEENGERFYRGALKKITDPSLRELLIWLADEEVKHKDWFAQRKNSVGLKTDDVLLEEAGSGLLRNIMGDQSFSLKETDPSKIEGREEMIDLAIEFERDTVLFFEMIKSLVDDEETLAQLIEIINEEDRHIQLLQSNKDQEENMR